MSAAPWNITAARPEHVPPIAVNMREADRREVWASHRHTPEEALAAGLSRAEKAWTCFVDGTPAFMWGVSRVGSVLSLTGAPWLLGTPEIFRVQREFLRRSRVYVDEMQAAFPLLRNYVHVDNRTSMRWLGWCGFELDPVVEVINDEDFYLFWRGSACVKQ